MDGLIYAFIVAFVIVLLTGPMLIKYFSKLEFGQQIREVGPKSHLEKSGIPTMGGVMIILAILVATLVFAGFEQQIILALFVVVGYGLLGLLDDGIKIIAKRSLGLRAWQKMLGQIVIALILGAVAIIELDLSTQIIIPFLGNTIELGSLYLPFVVLVVVGSANAVNLTDGLDGLAAGVTIIVAISFAYITYSFGLVDLSIFAAAIAGACLGFSWFNSHPAQVFMGDTGSLALGGAIASIAVLSKTELFLVIIGGIYVIEAISVILQVSYFKLTSGKRIFKMTPIHHHFELLGWDESKVVIRFWIAAIILSLIGLMGISNLS